MKDFNLLEQACHLGEPILEEMMPPPIELERLVQIAKHLEDLNDSFSEDEMSILRYRFDGIGDNTHSAEDTALAYGISIERVHVLESRAARLLRRIILK